MLSFFKNIKVSAASLSHIMGAGKYDIVFYAEGKSDYLFIGPLFEALLASKTHKILYVTSDPDDPTLSIENNQLKSCYIKDGGMLGYFFQNIKARIFITTLTDLGHFHFKKSKSIDHYVYLFHSLNSAHMVYRLEAFKNYDYILSPAAHISAELVAMEMKYKWPKKKIIDNGYARLDHLQQEKNKYAPIKKQQILIAPSWGEHGLIETGMATTIAQTLMQKEYEVIIQPHPMTCRKSPNRIKEIRDLAKKQKALYLNDDITNKAPFFESAFLITDWSGTSYEYAFTHDRPVIFINTSKPKCRNTSYQDIDIKPKEITIREDIGQIIELADINSIPEIVQDISKNINRYTDKINKVRSQMMFNQGTSTKHACAFIENLLNN
jgi:YidC/Oxa1 family membrane protein insertase